MTGPSNLSGPWRSHDAISWDDGPADEERCAADDLITFARPQAQSTAGRSATRGFSSLGGPWGSHDVISWNNSPTSEYRCKGGWSAGPEACRRVPHEPERVCLSPGPVDSRRVHKEGSWQPRRAVKAARRHHVTQRRCQRRGWHAGRSTGPDTVQRGRVILHLQQVSAATRRASNNFHRLDSSR